MNSLQDHFLIAMPSMGDPNFNETVTYVCEHNDHGALGIIINRPIEMQVRDILEQLSFEVTDQAAADQPVLGGGPVHRDRGFVLHQSDKAYESTLAATDEIKVTMSQDILDAVAHGEGPEKVLVALGCAGWEAGQLEDELVTNAWLSVPADPKIIFDTAFESRWSAAAALLGVDIKQISTYAGHA
jgi:putative transcriptional regulator